MPTFRSRNSVHNHRALELSTRIWRGFGKAEGRTSAAAGWWQRYSRAPLAGRETETKKKGGVLGRVAPKPRLGLPTPHVIP